MREAGVELCSRWRRVTLIRAVEAYLKGELVSTGVNCDHHHEEGHSCGDHGRRDIPAAATAEEDAERLRPLKGTQCRKKPAAHITEAPLMTEHSSILPMTVANRWSLSAAQA